MQSNLRLLVKLAIRLHSASSCEHGGVRKTMTADAPLCDKYTVDTHVRERQHVASIVSPEEGRVPTPYCHPIPQPSFFFCFFGMASDPCLAFPASHFFSPRGWCRGRVMRDAMYTFPARYIVQFPLPHNVTHPESAEERRGGSCEKGERTCFLLHGGDHGSVRVGYLWRQACPCIYSLCRQIGQREKYLRTLHGVVQFKSFFLA